AGCPRTQLAVEVTGRLDGNSYIVVITQPETDMAVYDRVEETLGLVTQKMPTYGWVAESPSGVTSFNILTGATFTVEMAAQYGPRAKTGTLYVSGRVVC
ncbi:MAG: hypothetical protein WA938_02570, partial [Candidatus Dormiibacterota bacterium]